MPGPTPDHAVLRGRPALTYLRERFPPPLWVVTALLGAAAVVPYRAGPLPVLLVAAAGPTVLFLGQRLVDDIDDFARDSAHGAVPAGVTRRGLTIGYVALLLGIAVLSGPEPAAVGLGVGTVAAMWAGPWAARGRLERVKPVLFLLYESVPFAILLYPAVRAGASRSGLPAGPVALAVVLWCGYEFWKFSRKVRDRTYTPFGLALPARLWAGALLAATATVVSLAAGRSGALPWAVAGTSGTVTAVFTVLSAGHAARVPARPAGGTAPWAGLPVLVFLPAAVVVSALLST